MPKDVGGADVSTASATEDLSEEVTLELQPKTVRRSQPLDELGEEVCR